MVKDELVQRSPVRILMKSIHGGLKAGETGVIAAPQGIGKTSVLVQIALDKLMQDKKVIHVSFTKHSDYVLSWYENIFDESVTKKNVEKIEEVKNEVVKNRVLMKFVQDAIEVEQILRSLRALIVDGGFKAEWIIIDGLDFSRIEGDRIAKVRDFARELGISVWYSCTSPAGDVDKRGIPNVLGGNEQYFDVVILLNPRPDHIELSIAKDLENYNPGNPPLKLDPKTLLILEG